MIGVVAVPAGDVLGTVLPALGVALMLGNLYYTFLARRLARKENRDDVTALPYGPTGAPVVDDDGRLLGILTEGDLIFQDADIKAPGFLDILGGMIPLGDTDEYRREVLKSAGVTADEVMTQRPVTVGPETTLGEVATTMVEQRKKMLPVVEGERLVGVISRMDILILHVLNPRA
jgi:CBS domain-containing protein